MNSELVVGKWYWTSEDGKDWWPLKYRGEGDLLWSNDDTIYEYSPECKINYWKLIEEPNDL